MPRRDVRRETPLEHLIRVVEEAEHREIDRLHRRQRIYEATETVKEPFRWVLDKMAGY